MKLHLWTPLLESSALSARTGKRVFLKMDALQPSGSFKMRGIGHACVTRHGEGARQFVSSSGGNAGLATAYAGRRLGVPVTVVVPQTTSARARGLIAREGAHVVVFGESWMEANAQALSLVTPEDAFIHPFEDPLLWEGHATLVDELAVDMARPDAIILSVGGGGLLSGVYEGLQRNGWQSVPIVAVETHGADSYAAALQHAHPVALPAITSIATSLGARQASAHAVGIASIHPVESVVVSDAAAVDACLDLLDAHRVLVEPACGASLAALFASCAVLAEARTVVVVVCGGATASIEQLYAWREELARAS